nr:Toll/interleukin-1 receptor (TIR) domain-containing protein [Tanacetum cinerariifolium]
MGSSSSSSSSVSYVYDVFLSFRGEDTRKTFVDHLYTALDQRHIRTYKDDVTLPRGESVGPALLKAIEESRHAVIIFSKNYANSSWCLDELVYIMKCRAENGLIVMPVFYDVDPSDVRKQKRDFGDAFSKQVAENTTKAELWRKQLVAASNISGWEPKNIANGHESMVIKKIVDTIFSGLFPLRSDIDEGLVGMRARMQDLLSQLKIGSGGVRMVGIWGLGGGDEHLLKTHKVDHVFPVRLLSDDEAIELFNIHAYNEEKHIKDYEKLSLQVVSYADGLPLALKVLGSFLYDKDAREWMSTMDRLRDIPESEIVDKLKISYDGLKDVEKELFLDIACFFRGRLTSDAMEIFDACGFYPEIGIKVLIQKSLITIDSIGRFGMHDLIQEMGHYIVRRKHPNNLERHSRVWKHAEVNNMCFGASEENDQIEAIEFDDNRIDLPHTDKIMWLRLTTYNEGNGEAPNCLSNELRMQELLWNGNKHLPQLKVLRLHYLERLVSTPDFNGLPNLQKLELNQCYELEEIHPSLGNHRSLKSVHVIFCYKLRMFPTIVRMEQLESLHIIYCKSLVFPEIQSNMKCLVKLDVSDIQIDALLSSIGERCTNLIYLRLRRCFNLNSTEVKFDGLKRLEKFVCSKGHGKTLFSLPLTNLRKLDLSSCHFEDGEIPSDIGELTNLQDLNLSWNNFSELHFSLSQLTRLKLLNLSECKRLVKLPELPSSIAIFIANRCDKLTSIDDLSENCKSLCYILLEDSTVIDGNRLVESMLKGNAIENQSMHLRIKGLEIPKQFTNRFYAGDKCRLPLPENWCNDFCGFLICAVVEDHHAFWSSPKITIKEEASDDMRGMFHDVVWGESFGGKLTWVWYVPFASLRCTQWWNPTHKNVSFDIYHYNTKPSNYLGIGASLVPMNNGSGLADTSIDSSEFTDDYTPKFPIHYDTKFSLIISPLVYGC